MRDWSPPAGDDAGRIVPGNPAADDAAAEALARLADEELPAEGRRRALRVIADALRLRGLPAPGRRLAKLTRALRPRAIVAWLGDVIVDVAPRIRMRDLPTLRQQHPGRSTDEIADALVRAAARASAGVGAIGGGVTAVQWAAPPTLLTAPAVLAAETVAVVAIELKLIGELHELYGQPLQGSATQRGISLLHAWASRRGVSVLVPGRGVAAVLGVSARHELRDRLARRFGRNLTTLGPLLTGAVAAAYLNRRATTKLAEEVRRDLAARPAG